MSGTAKLHYTMLTIAASAAGALVFTFPLTVRLLVYGPGVIHSGLLIRGLSAGSGRPDPTGTLFIISGIGMCVTGVCATLCGYTTSTGGY